MHHDLIEKDGRLFLFSVLSHGRKTGLLSSEDALFLEDEGARMSFFFAKKYYRVVYEACLRQASCCVLGIVNLGLITASGNDPDTGARLLREKGLVGLFRQGWTRVQKLLKLVRATEPGTFDKTWWEREIAERLGAEPGRPWNGAKEFFRMTREYGLRVLAEKENIPLR